MDILNVFASRNRSQTADKSKNATDQVLIVCLGVDKNVAASLKMYTAMSYLFYSFSTKSCDVFKIRIPTFKGVGLI